MALNQQQKYFTAYSQLDSVSTLYKSVQVEKQLKNSSGVKNALAHQEDDSLNLISESKIYALKKRLLLPVWLLEGVLLSLGVKEPWFESIACSRVGKIFASPSHLNVKCLVPFFLVWHELVSRIFHMSAKETTIKLQINKFISGTKKDIQEISKEIENIFSSPLKLFEIKPSKKSKTFSMSKKGSLNFIRHAQLENDVDGVWLTLNLTNSFKEICYPSELKESILSESNNIVSISPIVIQSMGARANLKKIINYLFLEFSKQESYSNHSNWSSFRIDCKKISHFHKDFLSTAPALYDHGVLGWNNCAPNKKISEMKAMNKAPSQRHEIICSWQLSDQVKEAYELEYAISAKIIKQTQSYEETIDCNVEHKPKQTEHSLFPEPPIDELKKAREEREIKKQIQEKEIFQKIKNAEKKAALKMDASSKKLSKKVATQTLFDDGIILKKTGGSGKSQPQSQFQQFQDIEPTFSPQVRSELADNEFLVLVSEFYESLKPMQKRAFERDRKGMNPAQFKAYMSSILQRKKNYNIS